MLAAHGSSDSSPLESKLASVGDQASFDPMLGAKLGPYRLVEPIGHGGMGLVYRAERVDHEYEQSVAIKMVRGGWLTADTLDRFRIERQILARLQHPNIATLLDGGMTDQGLPYLVMQYVDGVPIAAYCDRERLPLERRLGLFVEVCEAVAYAHRHLIVHRDLKPSNILVDGDGRVQLLDFGIAKLLEPDALGVEASMTRTELRMLTPLHAAPEQLRGESVTTATDVYALGLLLYELVVGRFPYRVTGSSPIELELALRETAPRRLGDALGSTTERALAPGRTDHLPAVTIAGLRRTQVRALQRELRGDLERVALMALRKEPERRYESAAQLAQDVGSYLRGEPVRAHADSVAYRIRRFVGRNRAASVAGLLGLLLVGAFSVNAVVQAELLRTERDRLAVEQERSEAVTQSLVDLFKTAAPDTTQGEAISFDVFLESAAETAESMAERPGVQARLLFALGEMRAVRGEKRLAKELFERSWALEQQIGEADTVFGQQVFHSLALQNLQMGEFEVGREQMRRSLEWHRDRFGEMHTDVAQVMTDLARYLEPTEALPLLERALEIRREILPSPSLGIGSTLNGLARLHADLGNRQRALELFRETATMLEQLVEANHPYSITVAGSVASQLESPSERLEMLDELIPRADATFGAESVFAAVLHDHRGVALGELGRSGEAHAAFETAFEMASAAGGDGAHQAAAAAGHLAWSHHLRGDHERALDYFERSVTGLSQGRSRARAISRMALALARLGLFEDALDRSGQSLELIGESVGDNSRDLVLAGCRGRHGAILLDAGRVDESLVELRSAWAVLSEAENAPAPIVACTSLALGRALVLSGAAVEGSRLLRESLERFSTHALVDPVDLELARQAL